ncbi:hypothetical protein JCM10450v2_005577 [Rhodotorula kratochvilovae]
MALQSPTRPALLHRLPIELILDIAQHACGSTASYGKWRAWRRGMVRLMRVSKHLRRILEPVLWEMLWVCDLELAVDKGATSCRLIPGSLGALPTGPETGLDLVKWLKLEGLPHFTSPCLPRNPDPLQKFDIRDKLGILDLEKCTLRYPPLESPSFSHLTSLWLDAVTITPVDFAHLVSSSSTPHVTYLAIRSLVDPKRRDRYDAKQLLIYFPSLPPALLARLSLLQVDLSDLHRFPADLFAHALPVLLTWRCWHRGPSSLAAPSPALAPKQLLIGQIDGAPLLSSFARENGHNETTPRTLILPAAFAPGVQNEPSVVDGIARVLRGCRERGTRVEWATEEMWQKERRLHGVLKSQRGHGEV